MNRCSPRRSSPPSPRTSCELHAVVACLRSLRPHREEAPPSPCLHHRRLPAPATSPPSDVKDKAPRTVSASVQRASRRHSERPSANEGLNAAASGRPDSRFLLASPHPQISLHKRPQISIQHAIHVAYFQLGAVILDQAIGLHNVRADLRSKTNVELGILDLPGDLALLLHLELVQLRAQHAHRLIFVLVLRALILTTGDQIGGDVSNAHG